SVSVPSWTPLWQGPALPPVPPVLLPPVLLPPVLSEELPAPPPLVPASNSLYSLSLPRITQQPGAAITSASQPTSGPGRLTGSLAGRAPRPGARTRGRPRSVPCSWTARVPPRGAPRP